MSFSFSIYRPSAWLLATGEDAQAFLQGQFSNDVGIARENEAVYGLWLDHRGKVLADSYILKAPAGGFWIGSFFSSAKTILDRLERYIVADDVSIADQSSAWQGAALLGEGARTWLAGAIGGGEISFGSRRSSGESAEWIFPAGTVSSVREKLAAAREIDSAALEQLRIAGRLPAVPIDIGPGDLPQEGGLEASVCATKGCYVGQEIMARLQTRGRLRRGLRGVEGAGSPPPVGAALWQGERRVGTMKSSVEREAGGFLGLALLTLAEARPGMPLALEAGGAGVLSSVSL